MGMLLVRNRTVGWGRTGVSWGTLGSFPRWPLCPEAHLAGGARGDRCHPSRSGTEQCGAPLEASQLPSQDPPGTPAACLLCQPWLSGGMRHLTFLQMTSRPGPVGGHVLPGGLLPLPHQRHPADRSRREPAPLVSSLQLHRRAESRAM